MASSAKPPSAPVPAEALKAFLRIVGSDEDALLSGMIRTATDLCEAFTRLVLIERDVEEVLAPRPAWTRLRLAPVRAILSVSALTAAGEERALPPHDHAIDIDAAGDGWIRVLRSGGAGRVRVRYRAGLSAEWNGIPEPLRQGIVRMAAYLYSDRGGEAGPPAAATALWLPYRRLRLG